MSGFKEYSKTNGKEAKFGQIWRAAKQLVKDGYLKLGEPQVARIATKESLQKPSYKVRWKDADRDENSTSDGVYTQVDWSFLKRR